MQLRIVSPSSDSANVTEVPPGIAFESANLGEIFRCHHVLPLKPELPAVGHGVRQFDVHDSHFLPVRTPPRCGMQAVHDRLPPSGKSLGNRPFDLAHQPRSSNGNLAVRFNKPREVAQIKIVSPEIGERVYRNNGIKKVVSKGK